MSNFDVICAREAFCVSSLRKVELSAADRNMLEGKEGPARQVAMRFTPSLFSIVSCRSSVCFHDKGALLCGPSVLATAEA